MQSTSKHGMQGTALDARPTGAQAVAPSMHGTQGTALDAHPAGPQLLIYGKVLNVVDEGLLISVRETNIIGTERIPSYATVLLVGSFPGFYDRDKIQATGTFVGSYDYTTVDGFQESHTRSYKRLRQQAHRISV